MMIDLLINQYAQKIIEYCTGWMISIEYTIQIKWKKTSRRNNQRQKFTSHVNFQWRIQLKSYNLCYHIYPAKSDRPCKTHNLFLYEKKEKCNLYKTHYLCHFGNILHEMISHSLHARIVIQFYRKLADCLLIKRKFIEDRLIYWLSERNFSKRVLQ